MHKLIAHEENEKWLEYEMLWESIAYYSSYFFFSVSSSSSLSTCSIDRAPMCESFLPSEAESLA
jgi:hypothetical protein